MRDFVHCAQGLRHDMGNADSGSNGKPSQIAAQHHIAPCFQVPGILACIFQALVDKLDCLQAVHLGQGAGIEGNVGFNGVAQGIHAGCGRYLCRKTCGEGGIQDYNVRNHGGVVKALFQTVVVVEHNACLSCLGSCAGGGGNSDEQGRNSGYLLSVHLVILHIAAVHGQHADGLGRVNNAAASKSQGAVTVLVQENVPASVNHVQVRLSCYLVIAYMLNARFSQCPGYPYVTVRAAAVGGKKYLPAPVPF